MKYQLNQKVRAYIPPFGTKTGTIIAINPDKKMYKIEFGIWYCDWYSEKDIS